MEISFSMFIIYRENWPCGPSGQFPEIITLRCRVLNGILLNIEFTLVFDLNIHLFILKSSYPQGTHLRSPSASSCSQLYVLYAGIVLQRICSSIFFNKSNCLQVLAVLLKALCTPRCKLPRAQAQSAKRKSEVLASLELGAHYTIVFNNIIQDIYKFTLVNNMIYTSYYIKSHFLRAIIT